MAAFSKHLTGRSCSAAAAAAAAAVLGLYLLKQRGQYSTLNNQGKGSAEPPLNSVKDGKKDKAAVDKVFVSRIYQILKILVPRMFCKESGYLLLIAAMLVARTYCDVWMIHNGTMIESAIIGRSTNAFKAYLLKFIAVMPFISLVNSSLKLGLNELKLSFRVRLTKHLYSHYLRYRTPH
ncbi:hypothetical protein MHYP_G00241010 [Metynnis hypsauchen]